jgi:hypothetical protein
VGDDSLIPEVAAPAIHVADLDLTAIVVVAAVVTTPEAEAVAGAILEVEAQAIHEAEAQIHRAADARMPRMNKKEDARKNQLMPGSLSHLVDFFWWRWKKKAAFERPKFKKSRVLLHSTNRNSLT